MKSWIFSKKQFRLFLQSLLPSLLRARGYGRVKQGRFKDFIQADKCCSRAGSKQESAQEDGGEDEMTLTCDLTFCCSGWQSVQRFPEPSDGQPQLNQPALREVHQTQRRKGRFHVWQEASSATVESLWSAWDCQDLSSWLPKQVQFMIIIDVEFILGNKL